MSAASADGGRDARAATAGQGAAALGGRVGSGGDGSGGRAAGAATSGAATVAGGANFGGVAGASVPNAGDANGAGETSAGRPGEPTARCADPNLVWRSANKTNYTSYPDPGSEECVKYNGCMWAGQFAACDAKESESWVAAHDIVAAFPDFEALALHDLCLRKGTKLIVVTVLDTCADSDCSGCCTQNRGSAAELIDVESYTDARWGVPDGPIEWTDLGPTTSSGCN